MSEPWYADGLQFECTRCGNCCTGAPGTVRVTDKEISRLARFLGMSRKAFLGTYTRKVKGHISLREMSNYDCVFFDRESGCRVYDQRPRQCRTWPFWKMVVSSPEEWAFQSHHCPGINSGQLHDAAFISLTIVDDGTIGGSS
jgi:uncharacterized protein